MNYIMEYALYPLGDKNNKIVLATEGHPEGYYGNIRDLNGTLTHDEKLKVAQYILDKLSEHRFGIASRKYIETKDDKMLDGVMNAIIRAEGIPASMERNMVYFNLVKECLDLYRQDREVKTIDEVVA